MGRFQQGVFARLGAEGFKATTRGAAAPPPVAASPATANTGGSWQLGLATFGCFMLGIGVSVFIHLKKRRETLAGEDAARQRRPRRKSDHVAIKRRMLEKRSRINQILNLRWESVARGEILVGDLMTGNLKTIGPEATREDVVSLMSSAELHHVLVVDGDGQLLGIISDRDILGRDGSTATELMTAKPESVSPGTDIRQAMTLMLIHRFSAVPVVESGRLAGILTTNDLVATLHCTLSRLGEVARLLQAEQGQSLVHRALASCEPETPPGDEAVCESLAT